MAFPSPARMPPGRLLLAGALLCAFLCWVVTSLALAQPWLGLTMQPDFDSREVQIEKAEGPAAALPTPSVLVALRAEAESRWLPVIATDLIEEPDHIDDYADIDALFVRQTDMAEALRSSAVVLAVRDANGRVDEYRLEPRSRPLASLPAVFWFQLFAGSASFLIGLWVLVLRPSDVSTRMFAVMGSMLPLATLSAAVYSTRELAISGGLFRILSAINHSGSMLFGCGLVALFLSYPKPLIRPRFLWVIPAIVVPWLFADIFRIAPDQGVGLHLPILAEMLLGIVFACVQWRMTRTDPHARAALRWLGLSIIVGCSLFVFSNTASNLLGWFPPLEQGYSFGFFLLMDVGLAVGLRRHRLFELDEWAYRILFWALGALGLIGLDLALIALLRTDPIFSLGVSLLVCGFVYLPIRNWLWSKTVMRQRLEEHELFHDVLQVAFASSANERSRLWSTLLAKIFDPFEAHPLTEAQIDAVTIGREGLHLDLPPVASSPAIRLAYPWRGRGLFGPRHLRLASQLVSLMQHADKSRDAYERGVREERHRIARDLHDDIGARLLGGLHGNSLEDTRQTIRFAIGDMRSIVNELTSREISLADAVADLRHEALERLAAAGLELDWPVGDYDPALVVDPRCHKHYVSMVRELLSNIIRHAGAKTVSVAVTLQAGSFVTTIEDDGAGFDPEDVAFGNGIGNIRKRTIDLGGQVRFSRGDGVTRVVLDLPLRAPLTPTAVSA